jgi:hypothetical protein
MDSSLDCVGLRITTCPNRNHVPGGLSDTQLLDVVIILKEGSPLHTANTRILVHRVRSHFLQINHIT